MASSIACLRWSQRNKTWRARWRERWRAGIMLRPGRFRDGLAEPRHLDRSHGGVVSFISGASAGAIRRLLVSVGGEHAECNRQPGLERDLLQPVRRLSRHVIEMGRVSPNHGA